MGCSAIVPAAGLGSRLGAGGPKALVEVAGSTLVSYVLRAVGPWVDQVVLVIRPEHRALFDRELSALGWSGPVAFAVQEQPTGSLDAVALGLGAAQEELAMVVWADQVGVQPGTVAKVAAALRATHPPPLVLPLAEASAPYVWVDVSALGEVVGVRRARDGDRPPPTAMADLGLFGVGRKQALEVLHAAPPQLFEGRERDFVYALPSLGRQSGVVIIEAHDPRERLSVNTPAELAAAALRLGGS